MNYNSLRLSCTLAVLFTLLASICTLNAALSPQASDSAKPEKAPATKPAVHPVRLDVTEKTVTIDAQVCLRSGALEFLLCKRGTKEHESIMETRARPSHVHAALLALGLAPGKSAKWSLYGPRGAGLKITLHWIDKNGEKHKSDPTNWLQIRNDGADGRRRAKKLEEWIFVGSKVLADGRYWADLEGGIISVANFASTVIDVPFRSLNENQQLTFSANTKMIPPEGTKIRIVVKPVKGAEKAPHARQMIEINHNGSLSLQGQDISWGKVSKWAEKYISQHSHGMVVVRAQPYALAHDIQHLENELRLGGVRQIEIEHLSAKLPPLPRTPEQARANLQRLEKKLTEPQFYLHSVVKTVKQRLKQIKDRTKENRRLEHLWDEYSVSLKKLLDEHKSSAYDNAE